MNRVSISRKAVAIALATLAAMQLAAQEQVVPGFTKESFALLKQRAEAGDQKAQELYKKVLEANSALGEAVLNSAETLGALDKAKTEIQNAEASTGILTESMLKEAADSLVVNGFFVGMPLADAQARLVRLLPGRKVSRRPPGGNLSEASRRGLEGLWIDESNEAFCLAENGRVVRLLIPGNLLGEWMGLQSLSHDEQAREIAKKFGYVDIYGIPIVEIMYFSVPGLVEVYSLQIAEYLVSVPDVGKEDFEKSGYGKGHALQFKQHLYRLGKENRVTYFGKASGSSDIGETKQGRNPFFESWLKTIRALGENASEGTLRIDAPNYKIPEGNRGKTAEDSPRQQDAESAGADDAKEGAKESVGGGFEGASRPKGALPGLFGVKFGLTMPADRPCETNNLFSLAYKYVPEKPSTSSRITSSSPRQERAQSTRYVAYTTVRHTMKPRPRSRKSPLHWK